MTIRRRVFLAGALAAPLFGQLQAQAGPRSEAQQLLRIIDGWAELRWTDQTQARLKAIDGTVTALTPAKVVGTPLNPTVRLPLREAYISPTFTQYSGTLDGGLSLRSGGNKVDLTGIGLRTVGQSHGMVEVNGEALGESPLTAGSSLAEGLLSVEPGLPGQPSTLKVSRVPLHPAPEALARFTEVFGDPLFTPEDVLAHVSGQGRFYPIG